MLFKDGTDVLVGDAFAKHGIKWVSFGSLGFTIAVPAYDAERARKILASIPNVGVIEAEELAAMSAPPPPLAPRFTISRVELDAELADLGGIIRATKVQWSGSGIQITQVDAGSLLARIGLLAGDVVLRVGSLTTNTEADSSRVLELVRTHDRMQIMISRKGVEMSSELVVTR